MRNLFKSLFSSVKKSYTYSFFILYFFLYISCSSTTLFRYVSPEERIVEFSAPIINDLPKDIIREGNILFDNKKSELLNDGNNIHIVMSDMWTIFGGGLITAINRSRINVYYQINDINQKVLITFDYHGDMNPSSQEGPDYTGEKTEKGIINQIKIKKLPKNIYNFETIKKGHRPLWFIEGPSLNDFEITKDDLPAIFANFSINGNAYQVKLSKMTILLPTALILNETPYEDFYSKKTSLREMIGKENQLFLIMNEQNELCAVFDFNEYKIYSNSYEIVDEMSSIIAVYSSVFKLLNTY